MFGLTTNTDEMYQSINKFVDRQIGRTEFKSKTIKM